MVTDRSLLTKSAIALILGVVLVVICYFFADRPVAWFVHDHSVCWHGLLRWPPLISDWVKACVVPVIILVVLWWAWKPGGRVQTVLLAISVNVILTTALKQLLKWGCGRCWPETWNQGNPSLIGNGVYGFHPFHGGAAYGFSLRPCGGDLFRAVDPLAQLSAMAMAVCDGRRVRWHRVGGDELSLPERRDRRCDAGFDHGRLHDAPVPFVETARTRLTGSDQFVAEFSEPTEICPSAAVCAWRRN